MGSTQCLDQGIPPVDPTRGLVAATIAAVRHARHAVAELWLGLMQWG